MPPRNTPTITKELQRTWVVITIWGEINIDMRETIRPASFQVCWWRPIALSCGDVFRVNRTSPTPAQWPRMDRNLQCIAAWSVVIFVLLCTHTESRLVHQQSSSQGGFHSSSQTHNRLPSPGKQRLSAEPDPRPHPVMVHCHPDTVEVVVQADLFDTGIEVDARHLRLGSGPPAEGSVCRAAQSSEAQFTLRSHLLDCGIQLSVNFLTFSNEALFFHLF